MKEVEFKVFRAAANRPRGRVAALRVPGGGQLSRKEIDDYTQFVAIYGAKGLAYIKVNDDGEGREGLQSPIVKFLPETLVTAMLERTGAQNGDLIFFGADKAKVVNESLGALRAKVGPRSWFRRARAGSRCGWLISHVRTRRGRKPLGGVASSIYRPRGWARGSAGERSREGACPRRTIWC